MTHDWNHDGKFDSEDRMLEYMISEELSDENKYNVPNRSYKGNRGSASWRVFFLAVLFGFICAPIGLLLMIIAIYMVILE